MNGIESIASERQRQIDEEGFSPEIDDMHDAGELAEAAACYAACANTYFPDPPAEWPFDDTWWKQSTARRDLVKAGALIAAEIDRLDRLEAKTGKRNAPGYLFDLRNSYTGWKRTKSHLAARNALESEMADWLRRAGLK